jgi:hypothetical protein
VKSWRHTRLAGCWDFGLGGQETARIPGAREPERLFLAGWEETLSFRQWTSGQLSNGQGSKGLNQPD